MDSMVELLELYEKEDQAYGGLLEASTQLYQYLLQPFRDMRELAMLRRQQIKVTISFYCKYVHKHFSGGISIIKLCFCFLLLFLVFQPYYYSM